MNADIQKYIDVAIAEVLNPAFAVTRQYLESNEIAFENGKHKVERLDLNRSDNLVAVYFPFKNERFFLQVDVTKAPEVKVDFVWTENGTRTYLTAVSEELTFTELSHGFPFQPLTGWSKGDNKKDGKSQYTFSRLEFDIFTSEAYDLNQQLDLLLNELEKDVESVKRLTEKASTIIAVCKHQYVSGNAGIHLDIQTIKRLSNLNLSIDIDMYISGNAIRTPRNNIQ
jgi:hypothetical protein